MSAKIHLDESTPHLHLVFVPVIQTKDKNGNQVKKIACSEYWKGKDSYKQLQDSFYKYITENGFDLERGKQREVEHLSTEKLKQITNYENIKYELTQEKIQPLETRNTALILVQNKELVKCVNRLKLHLSKSYNAIETMNKLQKQNTDLQYANQELKRENRKLKNYINKTFEVVKHLFNFPLDSFKRLVDNFVKTFDK